MLDSVVAGRMTAAGAADALNMSVRQVRRLLAAYREDGPQALVHANRGRSPKHAVPEQVRAQVISLARQRYEGVSLRQLAVRLGEDHGIALHRTTLRRIIVQSQEADSSGSSAASSQALVDCRVSGSSREDGGRL